MSVVLDLGLPDMDGVEVIEGLRGWSRAPIIVLSARTGQGDKVVALDAGADDYVTKPFGMDELLARLRAALRRSASGRGRCRWSRPSDFTIDLAAKRSRRRTARAVRLTPTEWHVLEVLVRDEGKLVGQRQLLQEVWGPAYETETNYLRVYLAQLRRKLEPDPSQPRYLITEPGMGYRSWPDADDTRPKGGCRRHSDVRRRPFPRPPCRATRTRNQRSVACLCASPTPRRLATCSFSKSSIAPGPYCRRAAWGRPWVRIQGSKET